MDECLDGLGHSIARSFWPAVRIATLAWQKRPATLFFRCIFSEGGGYMLVHFHYSMRPLSAIVMHGQLPPEKNAWSGGPPAVARCPLNSSCRPVATARR